MSTVKPKAVMDMYKKYIIPPLEYKLQMKGETLGAELLEKDELLNTLSVIMNNELESNQVNDEVMQKKLWLVLMQVLANKELLTKIESPENNNDPLVWEFKEKLRNLLTGNPQELEKEVKDLLKTLNQLKPKDQQASDEELDEQAKEICLILTGEKTPSAKADNAPTPKPGKAKEQVLYSEGGDRIEVIGPVGTAGTPSVITLSELMQTPLSSEMLQNLEKALSNDLPKLTPDGMTD